jgi:hypothetical protein
MKELPLMATNSKEVFLGVDLEYNLAKERDLAVLL